MTYDPANKPMFTAPGVYSVDYRSTDAAGNVETAKSVAFTITAPNNDHTAPVTTQTLDPAAPGAGKTYSGPVKVKFSALDQSPGGPAAKTVDVNAPGDRWAPAAVSLVSGDTVQWNFPAAGALPARRVAGGPGRQHGEPDEGVGDHHPGRSVGDEDAQHGGRVHLHLQGALVLRLHGRRVERHGRHGHGDGASGGRAALRRRLHRVPASTTAPGRRPPTRRAANPFASEVKVEAEGQHTVEFRSTDKAGNVETAKSVAFGIDIPDPGFPVIEAFADPATGQAPLQTRFSASGYDPDGGELSYKWEFADGTVLGRGVTRTYTKPGTYTAKVTATDDEGDKSSKEVTVTVTAPGVQPPTVEVAADRTTRPRPLAVKFTATGADPDGDADAAPVQVGLR